MCTQILKPTMKRSRCEMESSSITEKAVKSMKRLTSDSPNSSLSPIDYLLHLSKATKQSSLEMKDFFHQYTEEEFESYTMDAAMAVRNLDLKKMKLLLSEGQLFQCCNRFGESLINIACRRGSFEVVQFLTSEANVDINCLDDYGRTPLHDACWSSEPNFDLIDLLITKSPELLLMSDKRGHTPLDYTRKEHCQLWNNFLHKKEETLKALATVSK